MIEKPDMDLSKFISLSKAKEEKTGTWKVTITLINMKKSTLTVTNCYSEFEAKERTFLYLKTLLNNKKNGKTNP